VTVTDPALVKVQDNVDVPEPLAMVVGVRAHAALSEDKATSPVNPLRGDMVMVEVPAVPTVTLTVTGLALMLKSGAGVAV